MKFLILTHYFPPEIGAPQTRLAAVARELTRLGHEVEVVAPLPNYPLGRIFPGYRNTCYRRGVWDGIPVQRVWVFATVGAGARRLFNYLSFALLSLLGLFKAARPDFIFVESPPLFLAIPGWLAARLRQARLIFNVSDLWPDSVRELGLMRGGVVMRAARALERWSYRQADFVVAMTDGIRDTLLRDKGVPESKLLFLPNGVDVALFKPAPPNEALKRSLGLSGRKVVLYAGTFGLAHNLENVLCAARLLDAQAAFLFVGEGSAAARLRELSRTMMLGNVSFVDPVPLAELPRYFAIADAGLVSLLDLPIFAGARPSKAFPIMASAKPVIFVGSAEGGRLVAESRAGIVVPPGDPEALAAAMQTLFHDEGLAAEMGRNGRRYVEAHLQWPGLVESWLAQLAVRDGRLRRSAAAEEAA